LGQFYLLNRREYLWDGIIFYAIALISFTRLIVVVTRPLNKTRPRPTLNWREWIQSLSHHPRYLAAGIALLLNLTAARAANSQPPPADYTFSTGLWLTSLVLFFGAFFLDRRPLHEERQPMNRVIRDSLRFLKHDQRFQTEVMLVLTLTVIGLLLRAWDLEHIPANFSGDEGTQGVWALDALAGRLRNPFATGWFTVPTMSFFAQAASLRLFGTSVAGLRTLSALIGTATLVFTYLLARRTLGRRVALFGLALLTFNHYHVHFSRLASNQIADAFFMTLTLWFLTEALQRKRGERWYLAAGLTLGLSWYGYFGSRVILLVVVLYLAIRTRAETSFWSRHARSLILMGLMAFLVVSPLLLYYANFPENFSARFNQVSFFRWLENELNRPDHDSTFELVVRQVWRSISAFNHTLDPTFWYRAQIPILDFVSGILFVLGLAIVLIRPIRSGLQLLLIWFSLAIIFGWILTENPPSSMRMVIIAPAIALIAALGLDWLLSLAQRALGGERKQWNQVGLGILTLAALLNIVYYFIVYTPTRVYGNPSAETATVLARYLQGQVTESDRQTWGVSQAESGRSYVYFYGPPFMYYDFGTLGFMVRGMPGVSVPPRDQDPDFETQVTGPTYFVVLRERLEELPAIQAQYPEGRLQEFRSSADYRLMFVIYEAAQ
jgi:hypothetical protein